MSASSVIPSSLKSSSVSVSLHRQKDSLQVGRDSRTRFDFDSSCQIKYKQRGCRVEPLRFRIDMVSI